MDRLVRDDRKATVTKITFRYNQGMQNNISERTTTLQQLRDAIMFPTLYWIYATKN